MSKFLKSRIAWLFFLMLCTIVAHAQQRSVTAFIQEIESNSSYVFNYDVSQTDLIQSDFQFNNDYSLVQINVFFDDSPFNIAVEGKRILVLPLQQQSYKLCGRVMSEADQEPLAFANVYVNNSKGTTTDANGFFTLSLEGYKNEHCHISYLGYEKQSFSFDELKDCPDVFLSSNDILINNSIVVLSYLKKGIQEGRTYGGLNLDFTLRNKELTIHNHDMFRTLQRLPGITSPDDSAVNLNIRGGTADHNLINWEGVPLYDRGYLFGMMSSVNPFNVEKVEVFKSNHSSEFENKIGGVVNMYLADQVPEKTSVNVGINLTEAFGNVHLPVLKNKVSILLSGRKALHNFWEDNPTYSSYTQKVFQAEGKAEGEIETESNEADDLKVDFQDVNAKLIVQPVEQLKFQSSLFIASGKNENLSSFNNINISSSDVYDFSTLALSNRLTLHLREADTIAITHTYSEFSQESEVGYSNITSATDIVKREESNSITDQQLKLQYGFGKKASRTLLGYVYDQKSTELEYEEYAASQTETERETNASAIFHHLYAHQTFVRKNLLVEFGSRFSYSAALSDLYVSPSLSFRYKIQPFLALKTSAGFYHQFIRQIYEPIDNNLNLENAIWQLDVDKDSPVLNSRKAALGFVFNKSGWLVDVEGYYHRTKGLASENPNVRNSVVVDANNKLISKGVDFLINKRFRKFNSSIFYSISDNSVILFIAEEMENENFAANNNQLHNLKLQTAYRIKQFEFLLSYHYKSGLPYSNTVAVVEDDDDDDEYELEYDFFNNKKLKDYHRIDATVMYSNNWKRLNYETGFSVLNILNRKNLGSQKSILAETNNQNTNPEILEITKGLLPFTFNFYARVYW